jgi:hypothetical protein
MCNDNSETEQIVYRIWNKETKKYEGSYSRSYHDEYDFSSEEAARNANHYGIFKRPEYEIHKFLKKYISMKVD